MRAALLAALLLASCAHAPMVDNDGPVVGPCPVTRRPSETEPPAVIRFDTVTGNYDLCVGDKCVPWPFWSDNMDRVDIEQTIPLDISPPPVTGPVLCTTLYCSGGVLCNTCSDASGLTWAAP